MRRSLQGKSAKKSAKAKKAHSHAKSALTLFTRFKRPIALFCLLIGLSLFVAPSVIRYITRGPADKKGLTVPEQKTQKESTSSATLTNSPFVIDYQHFQMTTHERFPTRIIIPSLFIDVPIQISKVKNGFWEISETTASYGQGSAVPGENSNIVIFAHARPRLFGPLRDITFGSTVYLLTTDSWFQYRVKEIRFVTPTSVEEIKPTTTEELTIFTCSGFFDEKRMIVKAYPN